MTLEERLEYMAKTGMSQNADEPVHSPAASPEHKPETGGKPSGLAGLLKSLKELFQHFFILANLIFLLFFFFLATF